MNRPALFPLLALLLTAGGPLDAVSAPIDYRQSAGGHEEAIVDVRPEAACRDGTLPRARCLPVTELVGPLRRLANLSGMLWMLGSAGLTGDEHVLVVGERTEQKELMAGLLYLAGQRQISVLVPPVTGSAGTAGLHPGQPRSRTREVVYTAPVRDHRIILRDELRRLIEAEDAPPLMDGRSESEYWGQRVRGLRGGHLPGAELLPADAVANGGKEGGIPAFDEAHRWIVYGHDAAEGLVYLSRLVAQGIEPVLYLEGWTGWASDGALPVDSLTFRDAPVRGISPVPSGGESVPWYLLSVVVLAGVVLAAVGFYLGRVSAR